MNRYRFIKGFAERNIGDVVGADEIGDGAMFKDLIARGVIEEVGGDWQEFKRLVGQVGSQLAHPFRVIGVWVMAAWNWRVSVGDFFVWPLKVILLPVSIPVALVMGLVRLERKYRASLELNIEYAVLLRKLLSMRDEKGEAHIRVSVVGTPDDPQVDITRINQEEK